jgi:GNAT superfamily N-acetyltransferase
VWYEIDCLLYRSRKGTLIGILQYFAEDAPMDLEKAGNMNVFVHPRRQRRGIGLELVAEADRRWHINWDQQMYTPEGLALIERYLRGH